MDFPFLKKMYHHYLSETFIVKPEYVMDNVVLDARWLPDGVNAVEFEGKFQQTASAQLNNVIIRGHDGLRSGIYMKSTEHNNAKSYIRIQAHVLRCQHSMMLDCRDGGYVTGNKIDLTAWGSKRFLSVYGRGAKSTGGNHFYLQLQNDGWNEGCFLDCRDCTFEGTLWDNWKRAGIPAFNVTPQSYRNDYKTNAKHEVEWETDDDEVANDIELQFNIALRKLKVDSGQANQHELKAHNRKRRASPRKTSSTPVNEY